MYNIAIQNEAGGYSYIVHNNPSFNHVRAVAKSIHRFRYELDKLDPALFFSEVFFNMAAVDPKKRPSFYLGIRSSLGENHAPILVVNITSKLLGYCHENGRVITKWTFDSLAKNYEADPSLESVNYNLPRDYTKADVPPTTYLLT
jgi:hypothetical protein